MDAKKLGQRPADSRAGQSGAAPQLVVAAAGTEEEAQPDGFCLQVPARGWYRLSHDCVPGQPAVLVACAVSGDRSVDIALLRGRFGHRGFALLEAGEWVLALKRGCAELGADCRLAHIRVSRVRVALEMIAATLSAGMRARRWGDVARGLSRVFRASLTGNSRLIGRVLAECYLQSIRYSSAPAAELPAADVAPGEEAWLSLGTGPGRSRRVRMFPVHELRIVDGLDWQATGCDPQFRVGLREAGLVLPAGWYLVSGRVEVTAGVLLAPIFYLDHGEGFAESAAAPLSASELNGEFSILINFRRPVMGLRFDPSQRPAQFRLGSLRLQRALRPRAFIHMVLGLYRVDAGSRQARLMRIGRDCLQAMRSGGLRTTGDLLYSRYWDCRVQGRHSYATWVERYDTLTALDLERYRRQVSRLGRRPVISLLLPVYDTPEKWLRRCLDSVLAQVYPDWELCIADDASTKPHVRRVIEEYRAADTRVRVVYRSRNGHICAASNTALLMARGEFVGLLDHDDELRPHALAEVALALDVAPDLGLVYSDEDKIDCHGQRFQPYFKPNWNPDLLLGQNYVCHFSVIRNDLVRAVGGFREGFEGSQDHDLILRCGERLRPAQIHHIPRILYHWRAIPGSTAFERGAKDYAAEAGRRAVEGHLQRTGVRAKAEMNGHGHYRVRWSLPERPPKVSLIVPTRDHVGLLRRCVESIRKLTDYPDYEIVVVDNRSEQAVTLEYLQTLRKSDRAQVICHDAEFNFSALNNFAVGCCDSEVVVLVNNDVEAIHADWLTEMVGHAMRPDIGVVGAMLYYPDGTIQHAGVILGVGGVANHAYLREPRGHVGHGGRARVAQNLSAVTGACLAIRRSLYQEVGGLDESLAVAFNDVDFCLRVRKHGYRNLWTPFAELYHHESATRGRDDGPEKHQRFLSEVRLMQRRWGPWLDSDPAYNPNLTLERMSFELAFPPRGSTHLTGPPGS